MSRRKKRRLRTILLSLLTVALLVGGYLVYVLKFKEYDVADEEIEKIQEEDYQLELPDGTVIGGDPEQSSGTTSDPETENTGTANGDSAGGENQSAETGAGSAGTDESTGSTEKIVSDQPGGAGSAAVAGVTQSTSKGSASGNGSTSSAGNSSNNSGASVGSGSSSKPSVSDIKNKYTPTFDSFQAQANGKISSLVGRAKAEYTEKKQNGESINYAYFYQKYMGAANSLESQTDAVFNQLISEVENDLQRNGYSKSYAQSFRDQYNAEKEALRSSLLDAARN
ncbi:hypothetical protein C772_00254 [Bhargavaea cecembensis DSE10]|uniref:Uncharacterized protein n=1 Tax=Bhargavaea cecembensis DSE10 TaxID=1235279 RepID=M7P220_9BACL|nr:hypothetical protein [Bhargavaea cecembensis]EMR07925.1 hypothetical protein C772_00254 [Bhargavaea cecembensis DSE10]